MNKRRARVCSADGWDWGRRYSVQILSAQGFCTNCISKIKICNAIAGQLIILDTGPRLPTLLNNYNHMVNLLKALEPGM